MVSASAGSTDRGGPAESSLDDDPRRATLERWCGWRGAISVVGVWTLANLWWLDHVRAARLWDHEDVTYALNVVNISKAPPEQLWRLLHDGHYGPMQSILGLPSQWLFGTNETTVLWENLVLTAATGLLVYAAGRRLASASAGLVAAILVLLSSGMIENAHGALTMVPATTFASLAMLALVVGRGLRSTRWAVVLGLAIACMGLSRPMSIAFTVGLAIPAVAWSKVDGPSRREPARNGALALAVAFLGSIWWWATTYHDVFEYLSAGGSGVATGGVAYVFANRMKEMALYLDAAMPLAAPTISNAFYGTYFPGVLPAVAVAGYAVLRGMGGRRREPVEQATAPLPLWGLWGAVVAGIAISLVSDTIGWLMLPLVPWTILALTVGVQRTLRDRAWWMWAAVMVILSLGATLITSGTDPTPGNRYTWCQEPFQRTSACAIETPEQAAAWKAAVRATAAATVTAYRALESDGRPTSTAIAGRDSIMRPTAINLETLLTSGTIADGGFFSNALSPADQITDVEQRAGMAVIVDDIERVTLDKDRYPSQQIVTELLARGFAPCRTIELPDLRQVHLLVKAPVPEDACS